MIRYTCDICGEDMPSSYCRSERNVCNAASACLADDVCPACEQIGLGISVADVVRIEWRRRVACKKELCPDDKPRYAGHGGREKMQIYERLAAYRGNPPRLGALNPVAELTDGKVSADDLRGILNGITSLPIEKWRLISKALDHLEGLDG